MKLQRTIKLNPGLTALVPLVNTIFLVLLFYALSSRFVIQPGLAVALPVTTFSVGPRPEAQIVSITSTPVPALYFQDRQVAMEELSELLANLETRDRAIIIKADKRTPVDLQMRVCNLALQHGYSVILAAAFPPSAPQP